MPRFSGTLCRQASGRWAICRPGELPLEITSGDVVELEAQDLGGRRTVTTRIESYHVAGVTDYYSVDGYGLVEGTPAALLDRPRFDGGA